MANIKNISLTSEAEKAVTAERKRLERERPGDRVSFSAAVRSLLMIGAQQRKAEESAA